MTTTIWKGEEAVGYETKVILVAVADIIQTSKTLDEAFERVAAIANAEGVVIKKQNKRERKNKRISNDKLETN